MVKGGFPAFSKKVKLCFEDTTQTKLVMSASSGAPYTFYTYNLNGAWDVTPALLNTAMPGFNEWATVYNRYSVTYTRITTTFSLTATNNPVYVGIFFRPIFVEPGLSSWVGWRNLKGNPLPHKRVLTSSGDANKGCVTLSVGCPIWRLWGLKQEYYGQGTFSSGIASNPATLVQGFIYALTGSGLNEDAEITVSTTVTMYIKFYHKKTLFV